MPGTQTQQNAWAGYFFLLGVIVTLLSVGMPDFFNMVWTFFAVAAGVGFLAIGCPVGLASTLDATDS
jgi:hypothetical protein